MARVLGIGGVFFKAADPAALAAWYHRVLGLEVQSWGGAVFRGPHDSAQVWAAFPADTGHFEPSKSTFMINLVVDDIDGVLAHAAEAGVQPLARDDESDPNGRFAWFLDPAGVKVELWQPKPGAGST